MSSPELDPSDNKPIFEAEAVSFSADQNRTKTGIMARLRGYFLAGVLVITPLGLTIWFCLSLVQYFDEKIVPFIPARFNPETYFRTHLGLDWDIPGLGLVVLLLCLTMIGAIAKGVFGRWFVNKSEQLVNRMPLVRGLYKLLKQILETLLESKTQAFRKAVLVEYPRRDSWSIGFVTADPADSKLAKTIMKGEVNGNPDQELVAVFVPTTPNPTSGFLLFVPRMDLRPLDMPVEEAFKLLISVGIVSSEQKQKE